MLIHEIKSDMRFTQNRDLSWLKFNERVLEEASDSSVPLFERLKFLSIFSSNLDEFFMIRVGGLYDLSLLSETQIDNKSGMTAQKQLQAVYQAVQPLYGMRDKIFFNLEEELRQYDIFNLSMDELENPEKKFLQNYFGSYVLPVLSPQIIDAHHPFPHLENKAQYIAVMLETKEGNRFGMIPVPKSLPRVIYLPGGSVRYVLMEKLLLHNVDKVFDRYHIVEKTVLSVTRNADINPDDDILELEEDFRLRMKNALKKRARLAPVRLDVIGKLDRAFLQYFCNRLELKKEYVFQCASPLDLSYVYALDEKFPSATKRALSNLPFEAKQHGDLRKRESMFAQILKQDFLLFQPYDSIGPFLRLIKEAASDPAVISIKITLYRIDKQSRLAEYLIMAAENGKDITVIMELRARFDEENNIEWAERLEEAGCRVIYGIEGFKAHSKICLITRREKGKPQYYTQIGTGNYNEKTSTIYSDFSLMTSNMEIGNDANTFFKNISISNLDGQYTHLLVAPSGFKRYLLALIQNEIDKAMRGRPCGILIKINSLTDRDLIDKLSLASCAGVPINLIVRGICCILPGIPNRTENIKVISIVGRFLEHARVYAFGEGEDTLVYIASADLMTRNTERRVEIACPILDKTLRDKILTILRMQLSDTTKARRLLPDGNYERVSASEGKLFNSQMYLMKEAEKRKVPLYENGALKMLWQRFQVFLKVMQTNPRPDELCSKTQDTVAHSVFPQK